MPPIQEKTLRICCTKKPKWSYFMERNHLIFQMTEPLLLTPVIRLAIKRDLSVEDISLFGWKLPNASWPDFNAVYDTPYTMLNELEQLQICSGVNKSLFCKTSMTEHAVFHWEDSKIGVKKLFFRSHFCTVALSKSELQTGTGSCTSCNNLNMSIQLENSSVINQAPKFSDIGIQTQTVEASDAEFMFGKMERLEPLNEWQKMFYDCQMQNANVPPNGRRYHPDVVRWCIELYARSAAAYLHIVNSKVLILPSMRTIQSYRNCATSTPGLCPLALQEMERVMKSKEQLSAYVTFDEMKIKENLVLKDGKITGFVEWDHKIATHILVVYLRSVRKEISTPLAWYPTTTTSPGHLALIFYKILAVCEMRNIHIEAVIADGLSTNRTFFKLIAETSNIPHTVFKAYNPYNEASTVLLCSDVPHLLKTVRNSMYTSKPNGTRYMNFEGKDVLWSHVQKLHQVEQKLPLVKWTKLTKSHVQLTSYSKMTVQLARDVISWKVGQALKMISGTEGTSNFILLFDKWYEIMTCHAGFPIWKSDDKRIQWLEDEFLVKIKNWKNDVERNHPGEKKRLLAQPTMDGIIFTTHNFIELAKRLLPQPDMHFICFNIFTQDVLEGFFGNLRKLGSTCQNPDVSQASYGIQHIAQRKCIKKLKGGNTTFGKVNAWVDISEEPLSRKIKQKK